MKNVEKLVGILLLSSFFQIYVLAGEKFTFSIPIQIEIPKHIHIERNNNEIEIKNIEVVCRLTTDVGSVPTSGIQSKLIPLEYNRDNDMLSYNGTISFTTEVIDNRIPTQYRCGLRGYNKENTIFGLNHVIGHIDDGIIDTQFIRLEN